MRINVACANANSFFKLTEYAPMRITRFVQASTFEKLNRNVRKIKKVFHLKWDITIDFSHL